MGALAEVAGDENNGEGSRTFVFLDEGHTLGNALKTIVSRYPDVDFSRAIDILKRGLEDLEKICDHTIETFESEVKVFTEKNKVAAT
ncbi:putative DNA-directed RNA polymerases I and III subunit RPAC2 [Lucilia cuprina]|nr:putative DNA-directed RNA polymerases I and III subunit RPAC2 [Lucilia cuprina]